MSLCYIHKYVIEWRYHEEEKKTEHKIIHKDIHFAMCACGK